MMRSTPATIDASSVTSIANGTTRRATAYTVHPDSDRWTAMDSPMPEDAPVTRATLLIPTPYAASPGPASPPGPSPLNRRKATSGRLVTVERPVLGARTGLSMCGRRQHVASRRFRSGQVGAAGGGGVGGGGWAVRYGPTGLSAPR